MKYSPPPKDFYYRLNHLLFTMLRKSLSWQNIFRNKNSQKKNAGGYQSVMRRSCVVNSPDMQFFYGGLARTRFMRFLMIFVLNMSTGKKYLRIRLKVSFLCFIKKMLEQAHCNRKSYYQMWCFAPKCESSSWKME